MSECSYRPRILSGEEMDRLTEGNWDLFQQLLARNRALKKMMAEDGYYWDDDTEDWVKNGTA